MKTRFYAVTCAVSVLLTVLSLCGCAKKDDEIKNISDLNGKTVVTVSGTVNAVPVKQRSDLEDTEILYALNNPAGLSMLFSGKADAMAVDNVFAISAIRKYDSLEILDETLEESGYGIAFANGSPLAEKFSAVIREMKTNGEMDAMIEKWLAADGGEKTVPEQTWDGTNGTLSCCIAADNEPVCYKDEGGNYLGIDIDLVLTCAKRLGYRVEFTDTAFEDLLPSVAAGQADLAVSGITVMDERDATVDFSETYLDSGTVFLVRKAGASTSKEGFSLAISESFRRVFVENDRWKAMFRGLGTTLLLCVVTMTSGLVLGTALFMWDYFGGKAAGKIFSGIGALIPLIPVNTYLMIVYYIFFAGKSGNGLWAAIAAFTVSFGLSVYGAEKNAVAGVSTGQIEAAKAMGYTRYQALTKLFLPQVIPTFMDWIQSDAIRLVSDTALVEFIAVQDFQAVLDIIHSETNEPFLPVIIPGIVYVAIAFSASRLIGHIKINTDTRERTPEEIRERVMKGRL